MAACSRPSRSAPFLAGVPSIDLTAVVPRKSRQSKSLFDEKAVMAYFRTTEDERAAKRLASQASPAFLKEILFELDRLREAGS